VIVEHLPIEGVPMPPIPAISQILFAELLACGADNVVAAREDAHVQAGIGAVDGYLLLLLLLPLLPRDCPPHPQRRQPSLKKRGGPFGQSLVRRAGQAARIKPESGQQSRASRGYGALHRDEQMLSRIGD